MTCIISNKLYLGGASDLTDDFIKKNNVKVVINVARECEDNVDMIHSTKSLYFKYNIDDDIVDISKYLDEIVDIIVSGMHDGVVFVHCYAGRSRSASMVLAYFMREQHMNLKDAFTYVVQKRCVRPNPHFMSQLMEYERRYMGTNSFNSIIDDYTVDYMIDCLGISQFMFDAVKMMYSRNDKNMLLTIDELTNLFDTVRKIQYY